MKTVGFLETLQPRLDTKLVTPWTVYLPFTEQWRGPPESPCREEKIWWQRPDQRTLLTALRTPRNRHGGILRTLVYGLSYHFQGRWLFSFLPGFSYLTIRTHYRLCFLGEGKSFLTMRDTVTCIYAWKCYRAHTMDFFTMEPQ